MIQPCQALRLECWGKLGQDQVKLLALPHGAELVLALIKKDAGRKPLSNIANASRCSLHHSRSWNTFTWISRPRAWSSYPSCPSFSASASAPGTQGCYREVLGWEMVERWRQLAAIHSGPSVLALRILWRVHMRAQAVAFRKTAPDIPDIPGKWSRYEKGTSWDITWNRRMCPNGQLQPSRSIVGADERTSTQNFALLWLNLRCRYGRPLCAKRHVPSEVMDGKWVDWKGTMKNKLIEREPTRKKNETSKPSLYCHYCSKQIWLQEKFSLREFCHLNDSGFYALTYTESLVEQAELVSLIMQHWHWRLQFHSAS